MTVSPLVRRAALAGVVLAVLILSLFNPYPSGSSSSLVSHSVTSMVEAVGFTLTSDQTNSTSIVHQAHYRLPKDPISKRQCDLIHSSSLQDLADKAYLTDLSDPEIYHFHDGRVVDESHNDFRSGDEFCSVAFAPQGTPANLSHYQNLPIEGWGPDSIHAEIASDDIRLMFASPDFWGVLTVSDIPHKVLDVPAVFALYTFPYALNHPGLYQVSGEVEFQNYDWVMEDPIDLVNEPLPYIMVNNTLTPKSPGIRVNGPPLSRPSAACYRDGQKDLHGRWYRATSFAKDGNQTALNHEAFLDFAEHNTTTDEWGWTFAPDRCNLEFYSPEDHLSCFSDRTIQVLGDSNSRRVMKSLISGGNAWCQDPHAQLCQCEDHYETEFYDATFKEINTSRFRDQTLRDDPTEFGRNSKLYFDFVGGIINAKFFNRWDFFFAHTDNSPSVIQNRMTNHGPIDIVHLSFIGWDMASVRTPDEVTAELPAFKKTVHKAYPPGTRFIHRLANNMCCGNQNHKTRYSAPRFAMWNHMWRSFWQKEEDDDVIRVVDPSVLQGRRDAETAFYCPTTHLRASHVRLEQMMWMNAACEKEPGGHGAKMRDWGLKARGG